MCVLPLFGENPSDSVKIYFRMGHSQFDPSLHGNRAAIDSFVNKAVEAKAENNIDYLVVRGSASPAGKSLDNERLSILRCDEIASYIARHAGIEDNLIRKVSENIAWDELRRMVAENPEVPAREKVLNILDNTPIWVFDAQGKVVDSRKARLMSLNGGIPYNWMMTHLFPELQNAVAVVIYLKSAKSGDKETGITPPNLQIANNQYLTIEETGYSPKSEIEVSSALPEDSVSTVTTYGSGESKLRDSKTRNFHFAIKTNMLYDAALIPNIGAEFYLGKNISIYGEWMYAWWDSDKRHRYWRIYGGDLGLRWWFGRKKEANPLTGHHLGIYGGVLTFDFELGDKGYMGGRPGGTLWDRCLVNSGIEYGYSLPVTRRLNIDFSIGIGYLGGHYIKYFPFDKEYYWDKEYKMRYFGPTKAEIALVWLIGHGNTNNRKGGDR